MKKICISLVVLFLILATNKVFAQCDNTESCNRLIDQYTGEITKLQGQANTLKNQIAQFDTQIKLTTLKISQTEAQISLLGGRIVQIGDSVNNLNQAFSKRAVETYKLSRFENNFTFIIDSQDLNQAFSKYYYLKKIQDEDKRILDKLNGAKDTYEGQKTEQEELQKTLQKQKSNLNSQKLAKNALLTLTKNDEQKYQSLLAQAKAQLSSLSRFADSVGASLIPHQEMSDGWGKYYNQRDNSWGALLVNGDASDCRGGPCTLARIGCLVTSYSMVVSHFGGNMAPNQVAINPINFYSNTADFNNPGPSANGHIARRIDNPSIDYVKSVLNSGGVVIAGLSMNGGSYPYNYSDHWVVLRSVDGDSFRINDPFYPSAMNVLLKEKYSGWKIIQARVYN